MPNHSSTASFHNLIRRRMLRPLQAFTSFSREHLAPRTTQGHLVVTASSVFNILRSSYFSDDHARRSVQDGGLDIRVFVLRWKECVADEAWNLQQKGSLKNKEGNRACGRTRRLSSLGSTRPVPLLCSSNYPFAANSTPSSAYTFLPT